MMASSKSTSVVPCFSFPQRCGNGLTGFSTTSATPMSCPDILIYRSGTKVSSFTIATTSQSLAKWYGERAGRWLEI